MNSVVFTRDANSIYVIAQSADDNAINVAKLGYSSPPDFDCDWIRYINTDTHIG